MKPKNITGMDINDPVTGSKMAFRLIEIFGGGDYSRMHMIIVFGALMLLITLIGGDIWRDLCSNGFNRCSGLWKRS